MKGLVFLLTALSLLAFAACRDKVELEERGFVGAFSVDACDEGIRVGVEFMRTPPDGGGEEDAERTVKRAVGKNFVDAMYQLNYLNSKELNFSLSKACILGKGLLSDEKKLCDVVTALKQNSEIYGKLMITAAVGDGIDVLTNIPDDEHSVGGYIANYYKHRRNKASPATRLDLKTFVTEMDSGNGTIIPIITFDEDSGTFNLKNSALVKGAAVGHSKDGELEGLVWARSTGRGRLLTVETDNGTAAMRITGLQTRYGFREEDRRSICSITVRANGTLEEEPSNYIGNDEHRTMLQRLFAKAIVEEISEAYKFLSEHGVDGFELAERMKKREPKLFEKYGAPHGNTLEIKVSVGINN